MFRFKRFSLSDDNCAMKIGTDAVLLGSWVKTEHAKHILDIGTGCGILALMMAQKSDALIDAVEINEKAAYTAQTNFNNSIWNNRLRIYAMSLKAFLTLNKQTYDLIICNPPYFQNAMQASNEAKNIARHAIALTYNELAYATSDLLKTNGRFCIILPFNEASVFQRLALDFGLKLNHKIEILPSASKKCIRLMMAFVKTKEDINNTCDQLIIKDDMNKYTQKYCELTKDFLLNS